VVDVVNRREGWLTGLRRTLRPGTAPASTPGRDVAADGSADPVAGSSVEIAAVSKSFGGAPVLRQVSLALESGGFFALLGPSGSGKSTLLNLVAGFEQPDEGDIRIRGRSVLAVPAHARRVGVVFQSYALFPHLSVHDNLAYPLRRRGERGAAAERRIAAMLELVRLGGYADAGVTQLSGGQQQRVALARALIAEPDVLLMDEPMAALDKALRDELQVELKALQRAVGTTVIYITHDQREALALADRVGVLNRGRFEQIGSPVLLYAEPASGFVARFLTGATIVRGIARRDGEAWHLVPENGPPLPARWRGPPPRADGGPAELAIDPARIEVLAPDAAAGLPAVVTAALYGGDSTVLHLALPGGLILTAREPGASSGRPGDRLRIAWAAHDAVLFPIPNPAHPQP
jgi:ABC-type Fe3+/spermidine/putrescine transport system ATPase subunit